MHFVQALPQSSHRFAKYIYDALRVAAANLRLAVTRMAALSLDIPRLIILFWLA